MRKEFLVLETTNDHFQRPERRVEQMVNLMLNMMTKKLPLLRSKSEIFFFLGSFLAQGLSFLVDRFTL
jgi:hypothetical protein